MTFPGAARKPKYLVRHLELSGRITRDGQAIDASGTLGDGATIRGIDGLRAYLEKHDKLFFRTLCTKLIGYAFGRRESIADVALIDGMMDNLQRDGRLSVLIETVVRSEQFRYKR